MKRVPMVLVVGLLAINLSLILAIRASNATEGNAPVVDKRPPIVDGRPINGESWRRDDVQVMGTATVLRVFSSRGVLLERGELVFAYVDESIPNVPDLKPGDRVFVRGQAKRNATFQAHNKMETDADVAAAQDRRWAPHYVLVSEIAPVDRGE